MKSNILSNRFKHNPSKIEQTRISIPKHVTVAWLHPGWLVLQGSLGRHAVDLTSYLAKFHIKLLQNPDSTTEILLAYRTPFDLGNDTLTQTKQEARPTTLITGDAKTTPGSFFDAISDLEKAEYELKTLADSPHQSEVLLGGVIFATRLGPRFMLGKSTILRAPAESHLEAPKSTSKKIMGPLLEIKKPKPKRVSMQKNAKSLAHTLRGQINRIAQGVEYGFLVQLEIVGVGYRVVIRESGTQTIIQLRVGFCHDVEVVVPHGVCAFSTRPTVLSLWAANYETVREFASRIRNIRTPENYQGKGIRWSQENVRLKPGKKK